MLVQSEEIERWAEVNYGAASEIPRLLACLIIASCPYITRIAMPGGKGVFCGGPDGRVESTNGNAFVPGGASVWELGTGIDPEQKANEDFNKRLITVPVGERNKNTFVFATPRKWPGAQAWCDSRRKQNHWKDVRVITSDEIEKWFEFAPWVANDFLREQLKRTGSGPTSLVETWQDYEHSCSEGGLGPHFVIAGRKGHAKWLVGWLERSESKRPGVLHFYGGSQVELKHFLAACIAEMSEAQREFYFQRVILAEDRDSAIALRGLHADCVLVMPEGTHVAAANRAAVRSGCRVIVCCVGDAPNALPDNPGYVVFELSAATNNDLIQSVISCRYSAHDATELCKRCDFDYFKIRQAVFKC